MNGRVTEDNSMGRGYREPSIYGQRMTWHLQIFPKRPIFLNRKKAGNRKMPTEKEMIAELRKGRLSLPPLAFRSIEDGPQRDDKNRFDAYLEASWQERTARFAVECKSPSTPKSFQAGLNFLKAASIPQGYQPMLLLPFLSEKQLKELEQEGISGIDLVGNGVVTAPGRFAVFRSGKKNPFPSSAPIKNIYRKNSSMVGRVFLVRPAYETVQEILLEINRRNTLVQRWDKKPMALSTVSKALKTLDQDLVVRRADETKLLQPAKLLEKLGENYTGPATKSRIRLKVPTTDGSIRWMLHNQARELELPVVATGLSSVNRYAVMQRQDFLSVYCPRIDMLLERLPGSKEDRFPNLELLETEDEAVYFDSRDVDDFRWASPVQVCLELMTGDKRDRETAEQVKTFLLSNLKEAQP
ncbi:MAG: hypothetical protein V2B18_06420 [Pseudomonadota bacterium]